MFQSAATSGSVLFWWPELGPEVDSGYARDMFTMFGWQRRNHGEDQSSTMQWLAHPLLFGRGNQDGTFIYEK